MSHRPINALLLVFALLLTLFLAGCTAPATIVMTVGGNDVTAEEYTYFYRNYVTQLQYEDDHSDTTIRRYVEDSLRQKYALVNLAASYNISLTAQDTNRVDDLFDYYCDLSGGKEAFALELQEWNMTESLFRQSLEHQILEEQVRDYLRNPLTSDVPADDATVIADIKENFLHATQILIAHDEGDDLVANYHLACDLLERARAGEDFTALIEAYNEDPYITANPSGYYFTAGEKLQTFEEAVRALKEGEYGEVLMTDVGYHVILRLPIEEAEILDQLDTLRESYFARIYHERIDAMASSLEITYTEAYDTLFFEGGSTT